MRPRAYDRLAALFSIALLAGLAAVSYYLAEIASREGIGQPARSVAHEPDYFVEGFALTRTNASGAPTFRMSAKRLLHYPDDDSSEFDEPVLVSLDPGKPLLTVRAARGRASSEGQRTELHDQVLLTRAAQGNRPELRIETDYVLLLPEEDRAVTDHPVRIRYGASSLTGEGMEFDNAARVLEVRSKVHGVWTSPSKR